ncbi:MAG: hypothetical protein LBK56_15220, partial [Gracilibacteraceae bacterium]|nr:hypothetical protein [Gracilibacteraceae bacterium]
MRIYLETTLYNHYFDVERESHLATVKLFQGIKAGDYEAFTSVYVLRELANAPEEKRVKMFSLVDEFGIVVFGPDSFAEQLANEYVTQGIIPAKYWTDGLHIAIAAVNNLDMIISMNFQHIVKRKTKIMTK